MTLPLKAATLQSDVWVQRTELLARMITLCQRCYRNADTYTDVCRYH